MKFYLGTHIKSWLWREDTQHLGPLFVSWVRMRRRKTPFVHRARVRWVLDSGGFSEIGKYGEWRTSAEEYVEAIEQYRSEVGGIDWAAQQDWMCEPFMVERTGLSVEAHQHRTVENFLALRALAPHLPIAPVLQGWTLDDYPACISLFESAGVDLCSEPIVGVGSVCRRQATAEIEELFRSMSMYGIAMHGFGVKTQGIARYGKYLTSADSMAWSYAAARKKICLPECWGLHQTCSNCPVFAERWRARVLRHIPE